MRNLINKKTIFFQITELNISLQKHHIELKNKELGKTKSRNTSCAKIIANSASHA